MQCVTISAAWQVPPRSRQEQVRCCLGASLRCRVLAMPRGHVEFGLRCLQYVVPARGASIGEGSPVV